ncbi:MAG: hypothetical protein EOP72_07660 [Variovorax sp.]|jgi:hypothetical protein|nr:MAG: hypothetical protein EOP72_07660 [Variovorax sp.]
MKGVVFREFIEMVENSFSPAMADDIIEASDLSTGGAYTSVGTYDHREMVQLAVRLSERTGIALPLLLHAFGKHLLGRFAVMFPAYFAGRSSTFDFLAILDNKIHVEVKKLYPDAELPVFDHSFEDPSVMAFVYRSKRPFADLAHGLIDGCIAHFQERIEVTREDRPCDVGAHARFVLRRLPDAP